MEFKTEFIGGSTPEQVKLELTFKELTGKNITFKYSFFIYFPRNYAVKTKVVFYGLIMTIFSLEGMLFHLHFEADISAAVLCSVLNICISQSNTVGRWE